jgi:beta-lactamase superfamily II metal-dependent hydrolase
LGATDDKGRRRRILGRLEPRPVFRTDVHGDIEISTDGERLWIETERDGE